jgi:hypothetical protein
VVGEELKGRREVGEEGRVYLRDIYVGGWDMFEINEGEREGREGEGEGRGGGGGLERGRGGGGRGSVMRWGGIIMELKVWGFGNGMKGEWKGR